jgi:hypothetical protein
MHGGSAGLTQMTEITMRNRSRNTLAALLATVSLAAPAMAQVDPGSMPTTATDLGSRPGSGILKAQGSAQGNTYYVGTANGGVWKTTDGGSAGYQRKSGDIAGVIPTDQNGGDQNGRLLVGTDNGVWRAGNGSPAGITDGTSNANAGHVQDAYQTYLGRDAGAQQHGQANALIGLLHTGGANVPTDQMPTDQRPNPTGDGAVKQLYGDLLGRPSGDGASAKSNVYTVTFGGSLVGMGDGSVRQGGSSLGSLNGVGSLNNLFANSRGGDQTTGLLLPAVQAAREAARSGNSAHGSGGGGGAGKVQMQDFHFNASVPDAPERRLGIAATGGNALGGGGGAGKTPDTKTINPSIAAAGAGAGPHVKVFSGNDAAGTGAPQISPGAVKGVNVPTLTRK